MIDMNFRPILIAEIELSEPMNELSSENFTTKTNYGSVKLIVRLHHTVIGIVDLPFDGPVLYPHEYSIKIWAQLASEINAHLEQDELDLISYLPPDGIQMQDNPKCILDLNNFIKNAPFVSVIVCTHDRTRFLRESLPHLLVLNYPKYEIIVVDNAPSTSETYDYIQSEYKQSDIVRYVREDQAGLSWARNCGIRHSRAKYIAFTDDDAFADPYWLAYLVQNFLVSENVACVTGLALPLELEYESQLWFEQFGGFGNGYKRLVFDMDKNRKDHILYPYTVANYGAGVNMAFRTDVLRKLNGFFVQISQADDISMFVKLITNGYGIIYEPNGFVYHKHREDYEGLCRQMYSYGIGLSQFLVHMIASDWTWLFRVAPKIPAAIIHFLSVKSNKNKNKKIGYPKELTWLERKGMLAGPIKYWQYTRKIRGLQSSVEYESSN